MTNDQTLQQQAETYLAQQRLQEAVDICRQIIQHNPNFAPAYQTLGKALHIADRLEEAEKSYRQAIALAPNYAIAYSNLGSLYGQQKQWQKALYCYQKAVVLQPKVTGNYRNLARLWSQLGDNKRETEAWFRAYSLEAEKIPLEKHLHLGDQLLKNHKIEKAIACYRRALDRDLNSQMALDKLGEALQRAGEEIARSRSQFMIFALPRTGSSTLANLLNAHPEINCGIEPFHQDYGIRFQDAYIQGFGEDAGLKLDPDRTANSQHWVTPYPLPVLDRLVAEVSKSSQGIKHLDYSLSFDQNLHLLINVYDKIIFLTRKNQLKRMVSLYISLQAQHFQGNRNKLFEKTYQPINVEKLRGHMAWIEARREKYRIIMQGLGQKFFLLHYEDCLDLSLTLTHKIDTLNKVYRYLGFSEIPNPCQDPKIKKFLDPTQNKFNDEATYRLIPNIDEIAEKLGSEKTGYLFER